MIREFEQLKGQGHGPDNSARIDLLTIEIQKILLTNANAQKNYDKKIEQLREANAAQMAKLSEEVRDNTETMHKNKDVLKLYMRVLVDVKSLKTNKILTTVKNLSKQVDLIHSFLSNDNDDNDAELREDVLKTRAKLEAELTNIQTNRLSSLANAKNDNNAVAAVTATADTAVPIAVEDAAVVDTAVGVIGLTSSTSINQPPPPPPQNSNQNPTELNELNSLDELINIAVSILENKPPLSQELKDKLTKNIQRITTIIKDSQSKGTMSYAYINTHILNLNAIESKLSALTTKLTSHDELKSTIAGFIAVLNSFKQPKSGGNKTRNKKSTKKNKTQKNKKHKSNTQNLKNDLTKISQNMIDKYLLQTKNQ